MQIPAPTTRRSILFAAVLGTLFAALPQSAFAGVATPDPAASPNAETVNMLYYVVFIVGLLAVLGLVIAIARATGTTVDADAPAPAATDDGTGRGALLPALILFVLFAVVGVIGFSKTSSADPSVSGTGNALKPLPLSDPQLKVGNNLKPPKGPSMSVYVNGQQFLWRYTYPGLEGKWDTYSYYNLVIPAGITVMLDVTSSDVEQSWWVPQLGGSIDAVPGYINRGWIHADKPGEYDYYGAGTVVSGTNYPSMATKVTVLSPRDFVTWVQLKQQSIDNAMTALGIERTSGLEEELITGKRGTEARPAPTDAIGDDQ